LIGLDCQGRIKRWNDAAAKTLGLNKADVLGKTLAHCGINWQAERIEPAISEVMQSRERLSLDDVRFEMQGTSRTLGMNVNWIKFPDSEVGEVLIVGSDITGKAFPATSGNTLPRRKLFCKRICRWFTCHVGELNQVLLNLLINAAQCLFGGSKWPPTAGYSLEDVLGQNPRLLKSGHKIPRREPIAWQNRRTCARAQRSFV
jgi:PAS domain S-box-containing protein